MRRSRYLDREPKHQRAAAIPNINAVAGKGPRDDSRECKLSTFACQVHACERASCESYRSSTMATRPRARARVFTGAAHLRKAADGFQMQKTRCNDLVSFLFGRHYSTFWIREGSRREGSEYNSDISNKSSSLLGLIAARMRTSDLGLYAASIFYYLQYEEQGLSYMILYDETVN